VRIGRRGDGLNKASNSAVIVDGLASFETNDCVLTFVKETNVLSS